MSATKKVKAGAGTRLGTQIRGEMAEAFDKRGRGNADLVLHYSGKNSKDAVLAGQLEYFHFLYSEFDPDVVEADYAPSAGISELAGKAYAKLIQAVVKLRDGSVVWRRLVETDPGDTPLLSDLRAAIGNGPLVDVTRLEIWTMERLTANPMRLRNSLRALGWIAGARDWPLGEYKSAAFALINKRRSVTFEDVIALGEGAKRALFGAAVLELTSSGAVRSDLNEMPLTATTLFHRIGD